MVAIRPNWLGLILVGALFFSIILLVGAGVLADPDTYWHIASGRWIIAHRAIPTVDPFSNSMPGTPWVPHEWLSELIFAAAFQLFGWVGIIFVTALFTGAALAVFGYYVSKFLEPLYALFVVSAGFLLLAPHLFARPHLLAMPFMIAFVGGLVVARERKEPPSLWLLPLLWIWANLHGAFVIGLGFAGYFTVETLLIDGWRSTKGWLVLFLLAVCAASFTPNGLRGLLVFGSYSDLSVIMSRIKEWQPPNFQLLQPLELWTLGFLAFCLFLGIRIPLTRTVILIGLLHLGLQHARNVELVGFLAPLAVLPAVAPQFYAALGRGYQNLKIPITVMVAMTVFTGVATVEFLRTDHSRKGDDVSPIAAVAAARAMDASGPVFNSYAFGGFLIFAGIPPFIDGRGEMYGDKFFDCYLKAETNGEGLSELITRYNFQWAIIRPDSGASRAFAGLSDWHMVYSDLYSIVYIRSLPGERASKPSGQFADVTVQ